MTEPTMPELAEIEELSIGDGDLVRDLAITASAPIDLGDDLVGRIVPEGWSFEIEDLRDRREEAPRSKTGGPSVYDAESLIDYIDGQDETPRLYAEIERGSIVAVFDDHAGPLAGRKAHRAEYRVRPTSEWFQLTSFDGEFVGAQTFAEFIEDVQHIIATPSTADLLDLVRKFKASKIAQLTEHHDDKSGDRVFRYETETQISDELIAPDEFIFALPIYRGQDPTEVRARFRYRAGRDGVQFGLRLVQRDLILEQAFDDEIDGVEAGVPAAGRAIRGTCA